MSTNESYAVGSEEPAVQNMTIGQALAEVAALHPDQVAPDDTCMIQYTSGTTGFPKGALLHYRGLVNNSAHTADRMDVPEAGIYLREHLSPQKTPRFWFDVEEYPLTGSGKIQKFALREQWENGQHQEI